MSKLECPILDCSGVGFSRQVYVNKHLRDDHNVDLKNGVGGNMKLLRKTQQEQFSRWLETKGYDNVDLFSGAPIEPQGNGAQHDDDDDDDDDEEEEEEEEDEEEDEDEDEDEAATEFTQNHVDTEATTTRADKASEIVDRQVKVPSTLKSVLLMIQTGDKSGLDVRPKHASDTHDIVKEDGTLLRGDHGLTNKRYGE
jgi:cobalamin biosynthesis protein CobT